METHVVITDTRNEETFELVGDLSRRERDQLKRLAERVAQDTGWAVTITAEGGAR